MSGLDFRNTKRAVRRGGRPRVTALRLVIGGLILGGVFIRIGLGA